MFQIKNFMHIFYPLTYLSVAPSSMLFAIPRLTQQLKPVFSVIWQVDEDVVVMDHCSEIW